MKKLNTANRYLHLNLVIFILLGLIFTCGTAQTSAVGWDQVPAILEKIVPPKFNNKDFDITKFGAIGDGKFDCTQAFARAVEACHQAGGGRVIVPSGEFLSGAIQLKSNVNLHVTGEGVILFSKDMRKFLPIVYTRFEGMECMNYSPFIYAYEQENLAITGSGVIDGQADNETWWNWVVKKEYGWKEGLPNQEADRDLLLKMADDNIPVNERVFGDGHYLRPNFIQFYKCKNILIENVTLKRSPMWEIHPVLCENMTVRKVTIVSHGPNNDGCNPESCRNVLIKDCYFDTGDDCIAIKSGRNGDGRRIKVP
ncbi:MAG: glycoside hydrolase family 28 protein, partial [Candidatus Neomarinimicrobiota bacterium]